MNKLCIVYLGVFLLALHLSSQVAQAQSMVAANNSTTNVTTNKNGCERADGLTLLLPLALAAWLLHGWSY
ncbi:signal transducer CD24-like [Lates japonicus]|uniref:Signal transducer CD24-like protein n=1 Tax=Lates japonicus TaxID=270547 RepID=A0AAD3R636_LATJO|nr:signal transducer CD24-like protein [Lates japonicus]